MAKKYYGKTVIKNSGGSGAIYGIGVIGALVYFIQHATSFGIGVLGIIKAFFWPALLIYKILEMWRF